MPSAFVRVPSIVPTATSAPARPSKRLMSNVPLNAPGPFPSSNVPLTGVAETGDGPAPGLRAATVLAPRTRALMIAAVTTGPNLRRFMSYPPAHLTAALARRRTATRDRNRQFTVGRAGDARAGGRRTYRTIPEASRARRKKHGNEHRRSNER